MEKLKKNVKLKSQRKNHRKIKLLKKSLLLES